MLEILPELNKTNILSRISEMDIFRHYCTNLKKPGENFHSEFRTNDPLPSARIDNYRGKIVYKDFGEGSKTSVDCFGFVQRKNYNCTFQEAMCIINRDFQLGLMGEKIGQCSKVPVITNEQYDKIYTGRSNIRVHYKDWDELTINYFKEHKLDYKHVSSKFKVNPIDYFWLNKYQYKAESLSLASYFGIKEDKYIYKIYQPLVKKHKWYHNLSEDILQGYEQLPQSGDLLIITKAFKDVWNYDNHNIPAIAPGAEGWDIPESIMNELKKRFKKIYINFDYDYSGLKGMNKLKRKYDLIPIVLTNGKYKTIDYKYKDFADYCKANTFEHVEQIIQQLL